MLMGMMPRERIQPHWLDAIKAVILVVERNGPTMLARIGMMRALNHGKPNPELVPAAQTGEGLPDREMKSAGPKGPRLRLR